MTLSKGLERYKRLNRGYNIINGMQIHGEPEKLNLNPNRMPDSRVDYNIISNIDYPEERAKTVLYLY